MFLLIVLISPLEAKAAGYVVRRGDTLGALAQRNGVSVAVLARANGILNPNVIRAGRILFVPLSRAGFFQNRIGALSSIRRYGTLAYRRMTYYHVRWGDTLSNISARHGISMTTIRAYNPFLGRYPLVGQWLRLCGPCGLGRFTTPPGRFPSSVSATTSSSPYIVRAGDTLSSIASRYGLSTGTLLVANRIPNPNRVVIGTRLFIPHMSAPYFRAGVPYNPWPARSLIVAYAQRYGIRPALPLAVGWQESGFNQALVSRTGAVGVMQVEPYTARHISTILNRPFNVHSLNDNVHAGVFWLSRLVSYYGGNERLATAAYYQGSKALARRGFYPDTTRYVKNVMALRSNFGR